MISGFLDPWDPLFIYQITVENLRKPGEPFSNILLFEISDIKILENIGKGWAPTHENIENHFGGSNTIFNLDRLK